MQITDVVVTPFQMGRRDTEWRTSTYAATVVDAFLVEIRTDEGVAGIGATTAIRSYGDTPDAIHSTIRDLLAPRIMGKDPLNVEPLMTDLYTIARHAHHARCGIDLA